MTLATGAAASGGGGMSLLLLALPILLLLYIMFSQRRRAKQLGDAQQALQVGQEVMTTAGLHGVISALEGDIIHLRIAEGVVVRHDRRAVVPLTMRPAGPGTSTTPADGEGPRG